MNNLSRRDFLKQSASLSTAAMVAGLNCVNPKSDKDHPNLVIVFPDQMRGQALGFLDEDPVITPNLDRFARESLTLHQMVSNYPVCSPFRAMLMTGKYPHANKVTSNCTSLSATFGVELPAGERCWSDLLKDRGYCLGYIGKWHLDSPYVPYIDCYNNRGSVKWNEWCPPGRRHGFDFWYAYGTYDRHMRPMYWRGEAKREDFHFVDQWGPEHEADIAIDYIQNRNGEYRNPERPFALVVSMNPPHMPYTQFPEKYLKPYDGKTSRDLLVRPNVDLSGETNMSRLALNQTANYLAMITGVDDQFGRIVKAIDDAGLGENTIILFTSDHGNCLGIHNQVSKNNPYEESMRIPFLIRWKGKIQARCDSMLMSVPDIYPTILDLMGFKKDIPEDVQGQSYAAYFISGDGALPGSQLYLKIPFENPDFGYRGIRTERYKLVMHVMPDEAISTQLFDLKDDPYELSDAAEANPEVIELLLKEELVPWLQRTDDPWIRHLKQL